MCLDRACSTSSAVKPPSGPMNRLTAAPPRPSAFHRLSTAPRLVARSSSHGIAARPSAASHAASKLSGASSTGTPPRCACSAASVITLSCRARRPSPDACLGTDLAQTMGTNLDTPSSVHFCSTSSNLSPLTQIHRRDDYAAAERAIGAREGDGPGTIWGRGGPVSVFSCRGETL